MIKHICRRSAPTPQLERSKDSAIELLNTQALIQISQRVLLWNIKNVLIGEFFTFALPLLSKKKLVKTVCLICILLVK